MEKADRIVGRCIEYKVNAGYGFVQDESGLKYFAHHSDLIAGHSIAIDSGYPFLMKGQRVSFEPIK